MPLRLKRYLPVGSISTDVHEHYSIFQRCIAVLESVDRPAAARLRKSIPRAAHRNPDHYFWHGDEVGEFINDELFDVMNEHAPPYTRFGAHADDGADFGVFLDWDAIEDDPDVSIIERLGDISTEYALVDARALYQRHPTSGQPCVVWQA